MAIEKLKVFNNVVDTASTSAITTVPIANTGATSQAVIKNIEFSAVDSVYPTTVTVELDGKLVAGSTAQVAKGVVSSDILAGTQIVDVSSNLDFKVDTGADINYLSKFKAMLFDMSYGTRYIEDTDTTSILPTVSRTYAEVVANLSDTQLFGPAIQADSAFGYYSGATPKYARYSYADRKVHVYDEDGVLDFTTTAAFSAGTYGVCTDGTYFYGISTTASTTLERINVSDGLAASSVTMSEAVTGQASNMGGYLLHYNGFLYSRSVGSITAVKKIDVATGVVTSITALSIGSYCAGAVVTVATNGVPYIIEFGQGANNAGYINLNTLAYTAFTCVSLGTSTEYGNLALEIAAGVAIGFYNNSHIWADVNTGTATVGAVITNASIGLTTMNSNSQASSIANIPMHAIPSAVVPRDTTYSLYADGVDIQGV